MASRGNPVVDPADAKGKKIRGGSREMDMMFQAAGATTLSTPSNELYAAMQTGACDAALTSSTSLISFRLEEVAKSLTTGRGKSYWFMLEPLIMSKLIFDKLPKKQQDVIMALGAELEKFGTKEAMADDQKVADVYTKKGAKVADLDEATVDKWRELARPTAWKDYAAKTALSAELAQARRGRPRLLTASRVFAMVHGLDGVETESLAASPADAASIPDRILARVNQRDRAVRPRSRWSSPRSFSPTASPAATSSISRPTGRTSFRCS